MSSFDRKSFIYTLGLAGAGALLAGSATAGSADPTPPKAPIKRVLRMAHLTDIHVKTEKVAEHGMAAALYEVNNMEDKPDFIMNGGDAIMNAAAVSKANIKEQWACYHRIMKDENSLPVYNCIGNHDVFGWMMPSPDHLEAKKWAKQEYQMQESYYSFVVNGWKMIVLDSIHGRRSVPGYCGKLDDRQMDWLKNELEATPASTHVCIISHIPILAICCLFDSMTKAGKLKITENNMHCDSDQLVSMFYKAQNIRACLSGHIHLIDYVNYIGTDYFCNGAVAGEWWRGRHQQFDPAYCIMDFFEDGTVTRKVHYYKWKA